MKTATFNGTKFNIDLCGAINGLCESPVGGKPTITICADLKTRAGLITALHESLHAEGWAKSEEVVDRVSEEIGRFLWRLGFRIR